MTDKKYPILFYKKEECCGCTACYATCPCRSILMEEDEEGFEYPVIDYEKCICCYKCIEVCPVKRYSRIMEYCRDSIIINDGVKI